MDNSIIQFAMMSSFQSNPISVEDAREWLQQIIPQIIPIAGSVFNNQIDLYKLIYIYIKYKDEQDIKIRCEAIFTQLAGIYDNVIRYIQRLQLKELPLSE